MDAPFSLCITLLADRLPAPAALRAALPGVTWSGRAREGAEDAAWWMAGAPGQLVALPGGGRVLVDWLDRPYPDALGASGEPGLGIAAAAGAFGQGATPGALARAVLHSPDQGDALPAHHAAVLRLRWMRGVPGADQPVAAQLDALLDLALGLMVRFPDDLRALFVPAGELVMDAAAARRQRAAAQGAGVLPIGLVAGLRVLRVGDPAGWVVMDSVGHAIVGFPDLEVAFIPGAAAGSSGRTASPATPTSIAGFLRDLGLYMAARGEVLLPGHLLEGPGSRYRVTRPATPLLGPPRRVLRLLPVDGAPLPALLEDGWRMPEAQAMPAIPDTPGDDAAIRPPSFDEPDDEDEDLGDEDLGDDEDDDLGEDEDSDERAAPGVVAVNLPPQDEADGLSEDSEDPKDNAEADAEADAALKSALDAAIQAFDLDLSLPLTPGRRG